MRQASITIEVLISMLILFLVIATSVTTIKQLRLVQNKQEKYETDYITFLSLHDLLDDTICQDGYKEMQGQFALYSYSAKCTLVDSLRTYQKAFEIGDAEGNIGSTLVSFYKVILHIKTKNFDKTYTYNKTVTKSLL
ncbi:hypothetical protein LCX93_01350 [Sulfurimonas sp. SWIR-19]|uniref:hypothetical protein n=1 Tax=Sulfurimonas sp. SWIR-19 TaxID=2878390 RepID=UPI001CF2BE97|nr:hypothetical protein [Sulfurimonas sp. SWIR-19]UCN00589.1 hypothetical protein LCX93_01350 [Sulfurimonas sp. SWIR-19]